MQKAINMHLVVSYTPYATYPKEQTDDMVMLAQFEEGNLIYDTCDNAESSEKPNNNLTIPPLISEEEIDAMDSGDESEDEPLYTDIL